MDGYPVVQEMTLAGAYVRAIGEGDLDCPVYGVDTSPELLLVCGLSSIEQVFLFDLASGAHLRSLGPTGPAAGQLAGSRGLRLTPDGAHILVAEYNNNRLSFFTLTGEFVRCMGSGVVVAPSAIEFATNGDILVASQGNDCVYVYSPDGSTLLRTLGAVEEGADALLVGPTALALHGDQLYVLNQNDARVQVFN